MDARFVRIHVENGRRRWRMLAATAKPSHRMPAPSVWLSPKRGFIVEPMAATRTRASSPMPRSRRTTVVASVRERATGAVSAILTTSPPMLLGRKLLKNIATRNDDVSDRNLKSRCCALNRSAHRHVLVNIIPRYNGQSGKQPRWRSVTRAKPEAGYINTSKEDPQEGHADGRFRDGHQRPRFGLAPEGDSGVEIINKNVRQVTRELSRNMLTRPT